MAVSRLYIILIGFASGIFLRSFFVLDWSEIIFILLVALALLVVFKVYTESEHRFLLAAVAIFIFGFCIGVVRLQIADEEWLKVTRLDSENSFTGIVIREPDERQNSTHLYVQSEENLLLIFASPYIGIEYGDEVLVTGDIALPESFTTELGREFDYPGYLKSKGVSFVVRRPESVEIVSSDNGYQVIAYLLVGKEWFLEKLSKVLPMPAYGLGAGILLGEQQALGEDLLDVFRDAGVIHIVVLSGYNVMLVVGLVLFVLSYTVPRRHRMWAVLVFITCFALMVGLSATVVRASIMGALFVVAYSLGRQYAVLRALMIAGATMLFINPYLLVYDIGFQLSFMATLGLIAALPKITAIEGGFVKKSFLGLACTTVATQIAVFPLLIYHIGQVSTVAIISNILIVPAVPFAMLATFFTGIFSGVNVVLGSVTSVIALVLLQYIIFVAELMSALPFSTSTLPPVSGYYVFVMYGFIGATVYFTKIRNKKTSAIISEIDNWQIDEEKDVVGKVSTTSSSTPIFFR